MKKYISLPIVVALSATVAGIHGMTAKEQIKFDDEKSNQHSPRLFQKKG